MPPAAFVSTMVWQPAAIAVRTPCTTVAGEWPSYRWVRPRKTSASQVGDADRADDREVAGHRRRGQRAEVGERQLGVGCSDRVGRGRPAGAEHYGDVVAWLASRLGQSCGAGRGGFVRRGCVGICHVRRIGLSVDDAAATRPNRPGDR